MRYSTYSNIDRVAERAFHKGRSEAFRDAHEVVFEGRLIGLHYYVSYVLTRETSPNTLALATSVRFEDKKGKYVWKVLRPIYRRLAPFMLDRMAVAAPD
jgi:hypothetical protein